jgi:hypothetical protein
MSIVSATGEIISLMNCIVMPPAPLARHHLDHVFWIMSSIFKIGIRGRQSIPAVSTFALYDRGGCSLRDKRLSV